jgi:hypothetical protein
MLQEILKTSAKSAGEAGNQDINNLFQSVLR